MVKAIITDFDGTLVDTYYANESAYMKAFAMCGYKLTSEDYRKYYGLRFDAFMNAVGIRNAGTRNKIAEIKKAVYPDYFHLLKVNEFLLKNLLLMKNDGIKIAIATTARKENLMNALNHLGIANCFDLILAGNDVKNGKPDPEIYILAMEQLGVNPNDVVIYEDSEVGLQAAKNSGAHYIQITKNWFEI